MSEPTASSEPAWRVRLTARLRRLRPAWVGPLMARLGRSRAWRIYQHIDARAWTRLAAAVTFSSFVAFFPVLALCAALGAALLSRRRLDDVEAWFADQVPGISEQLDLGALFEHADTVGLVALLLVLPTGAGWIDTLRGSLRALWDLPEPQENVLLRKVKDLGILAGFGAVTLVSLGASALGMTVVHWAGRWLGVARDGAGAVLLQLTAYLLAIVVSSLLLAYLLVWLPGVRPPRRAVAAACVMGALGFELLKALLGGYLTGVAGRSVYGAFGVPVALLVWINLVAKLLLLCCAWTLTAVTPQDRPRRDVLEGDPSPPADGSDPAGAAGAGAAGAAGPGAPSTEPTDPTDPTEPTDPAAPADPAGPAAADGGGGGAPAAPRPAPPQRRR